MKHRQYIPTISDHHTGLNGWIASHITNIVGTMWMAYMFCGLAFVALPSAISQGSPTVLVNWLSSNLLQLVLLPIIMVGQKAQGDAADARSVATYKDTEAILDRLDETTKGGITTILERIDTLEANTKGN